MIPVRITIRRIVCHRDLMAEYENPLPNPCPHREGEVFLVLGRDKGHREAAEGGVDPFLVLEDVVVFRLNGKLAGFIVFPDYLEVEIAVVYKQMVADLDVVI